MPLPGVYAGRQRRGGRSDLPAVAASRSRRVDARIWRRRSADLSRRENEPASIVRFCVSEGRDMTVDASKVIVRELEAGESLLWSGQPRKGIVFRSSDLFLIPFSIFWGGFALFWEGSVLSEARRSGNSISLFMVLWGIPFVLIGLYLMFFRFIVDARRREHTCYGLTDRRAIIVTGLF